MKERSAILGPRATGPRSRKLAALASVAGAVVVLVPLAWMVSTSLKEESEVFRSPIEWIPSDVRPENYAEATRLIPFWRYFLNSLIVVLPVTVGATISTCAAAYAFARLRARGIDILFVVVLATIMIPGEVTLVPSFLLFDQLGWVGTYLPLIVPAQLAAGGFDAAASIFLLRQFFLTIPREHDDAARVDGHGFLSILLRVVIPQSWPAVALVAAFAFVHSWNDFLGPLLYLTEQDRYTLPLGLNFFKDIYNTRWAHLMAASVIALIPPVAVFFVAQRAFTEGVVITGRR